MRHMSLQHILRSPGDRFLREITVDQAVPTSVSTIPSVFNSESNVSQINQSNLPGRLRQKGPHLASLASLEDDEDVDEVRTDSGTLLREIRPPVGCNRASSGLRTGTKRNLADCDAPTISSYLDALSTEPFPPSVTNQYPPFGQISPPVSRARIDSKQRKRPTVGFRQVPVPSPLLEDLSQTQPITAIHTVRVHGPLGNDIRTAKGEPHNQALLCARYSNLEDSLSESSVYFKHHHRGTPQAEGGGGREDPSRYQSRDNTNITEGSVHQRKPAKLRKCKFFVPSKKN